MNGAFLKSGRKRLCVSSMWLSWIWLAGLLLGSVATFFFRIFISSLLPALMRIYCSVPIKLLFTLLPFLLSAFVVYSSHFGWVFLICGAKAVCFAICSSVLCLHYGQAGWLARWLLMFSDVCTLPLLFLYWTQSVTGGETFTWRKHVIFMLAIMLFTIVDYRIVTPYAVKFVII